MRRIAMMLLAAAALAATAASAGQEVVTTPTDVGDILDTSREIRIDR